MLVHPPPQPPEPVVLDTNAVLDWLLFNDPRSSLLCAALDQRRLRWLVTPSILAELRHALQRSFAARWEERRERLLRQPSLADFGLVDPPAAPAHGLRCTDENDQKFLDLALHVGVRWLITRDRALLRLRRPASRQGLTIIQPEQWRPAG